MSKRASNTHSAHNTHNTQQAAANSNDYYLESQQNDAANDGSSNVVSPQPSGGKKGAAHSNSSHQGSNNASNATAAGGDSKEELDHQEVRCLIDNHSVGGIIGHDGTHVKRIREETKVFLSILKSSHKSVKERVMVIKGRTVRVAKSLHMIAEHLVEAAAAAEKKGFTHDADVASDSTVIKLLVHKSIVGAVIGQKGAVIKETQRATGTRLQVSNEPLPNSTEKTISIMGTPNAIHQALSRILVQLHENPVRAGTRVVLYIPGPPMFAPPLASPYGFASPYGAPFFYGALAQSLLRSGVSPLHPQGTHPQAAHLYGQQTPTRQELPIPTVCAGGVIGKGGAVIRDLRLQSGTNISIAASDPSNPNERVVTVSGPAAGVQFAIAYIRQIVDQYQNSGPNRSATTTSPPTAAAGSSPGPNNSNY